MLSRAFVRNHKPSAQSPGSNSDLVGADTSCRPSILEPWLCRLRSVATALGVAMVALQQAYQAASFSASLCAIKSDLPALVACLVRTRTWKSAALILSLILAQPPAHSNRRWRPCRRRPAMRRHRCFTTQRPHHRPLKLLKVQDVAAPGATCSSSQGSAPSCQVYNVQARTRAQHTGAVSRVCSAGSFLDSMAWAQGTSTQALVTSRRPLRSRRRACCSGTMRCARAAPN